MGAALGSQKYCWSRGTDEEDNLFREINPNRCKDWCGESQRQPSTASQPRGRRACRLRIIAVNDVYELENLARLKTLVAQELMNTDNNVITTIAGDFLAPSLLSSLDHGYGMVKVLNQIPIDYCCFGNHESDIPYAKLVQRIEEFKGVWLNSNMPDFQPDLPVSHYRELTGVDGKPGARQVVLTGFCVGGGKFKAMYRQGVFDGAAATMVPVCEAAPKVVADIRLQHPLLDTVIPLTHQDMPEDRELAQMGLFHVIIGGHDHEVMLEPHGACGCQIVKAGQDAENAAIIDLVWRDNDKEPTVTIEVRELSKYAPDPEVDALIQKLKRPVIELQSAMLYEVPQGANLSSIRVKYGDSTMARFVAEAVRDCLGTDAAIMNSGAIRGNQDYADIDYLSYSHLTKECPFPSPMVVTRMPFEILSEAIYISRKPWWEKAEGAENAEAASALQADVGVIVDPKTHRPTTICGDEPDDGLYNVACDTRVLRKNQVFIDYCRKFPERIPPDDAGRPVLPILVEYFCGQLWTRLLRSIAGEAAERGGYSRRSANAKGKIIFSFLDREKNGMIDALDLEEVLKQRLGPHLASRIIIDQMIGMVDVNNDGVISEDELQRTLQDIFGNEMQAQLTVHQRSSTTS